MIISKCHEELPRSTPRTPETDGPPSGCPKMLNGAMDKYTGAGLISLAMGGLSLILGVLFRTGLVHADLASLYRDPAAPVTQRNSVFGFIPLGLAFVALGLLPLIATS